MLTRIPFESNAQDEIVYIQKHCFKSNNSLILNSRIKSDNQSNLNVKCEYHWVILNLNVKDGTVDIPVEYRDIEKYCASLAHKTNHR